MNIKEMILKGDKKILDEFCEINTKIIAESECIAFKEGFKIAAKLMSYVLK